MDARFLLIPAYLVALAACDGRDPVAAQANQMTPETNMVALSTADKSTESAPPTEDGGSGATEATGTIPQALRGRWGMVPADCTTTRGDAKGLLIVSGDGLRFYESTARPAAEIEDSADSISGMFAFTGEGMHWTKFQSLEIQNGKLIRSETDPAHSYTYVACD